MRSSPQRTFFPFLHPWLLAVSFAISSALASYTTMATPAKAGLLFLGLLLPFFYVLVRLLLSPPAAPQRPSQGHDPFPKIPLYLWLLLIAAGLGLRFYHLTSLSVWPDNDEGLNASPAIDLSEHWNWKFFYGKFQSPGMGSWVLGLFFKLFSPSLFSLWLYPALLSILVMVLGYGAASRHLPKPIPFVFLAFLALGFWPLYVSRFCFSYALLSAWEFAAFCGLGFLLRKKSISLVPGAGLLGLWTGLGFYLLYPGPLLLILFSFSLPWSVLKNGRKAFLFFLAVAALVGLPMGWAYLVTPHVYFPLGVTDGVSEPGHLKRCLFYVTNLFWTNHDHLSGYGAYWGGFLNPLMTSCFFLGLLTLIHHRRDTTARFLLFALPLCWLPAFLTFNIEMYRVLPALPLVLAIAGYGCLDLLRSFPGHGKFRILVALLIISGGLDAYHLFGPYARTWKDPGNWRFKRLESFRAYELLKPKAEALGPGHVLSELGDLAGDPVLRTACYPFDRQGNPSLRERPANWVAVLPDANLEPLLHRRFPDAQWRWLSSDLARPNGGALIGFILLNGNNGALLKDWIEMDRALRCLNWLDGVQENPSSPGEKEDCLREVLRLAQKDPLLGACLWEKRILLSERTTPPQTLALVQEALAHGNSSAYFYFELGNQLSKRGEFKKAEEAYGKAVRAEGNRTQAFRALQELRAMEKNQDTASENGRTNGD